MVIPNPSLDPRGGPEPDIEGEKSERPMQVLKPKEVKVTFLLCFGVSRACIFWLLENRTLAQPHMMYAKNARAVPEHK